MNKLNNWGPKLLKAEILNLVAESGIIIRAIRVVVATVVSVAMGSLPRVIKFSFVMQF